MRWAKESTPTVLVAVNRTAAAISVSHYVDVRATASGTLLCQDGVRVLPMAMFLHLAPESRVTQIRRNGIRRLRRASGEFPGGVFATPVTRNFYVTHQWLRELKRRNQGALVGIYFRIPDEEQIWVGHYNQAHRWMSAAEAVALFLVADNAEGGEVVIPRRIEPAEIHRIRDLPQVIGWRFLPAGKGRRPCACRFCTRGDYGARRLRERFGE